MLEVGTSPPRRHASRTSLSPLHVDFSHQALSQEKRGSCRIKQRSAGHVVRSYKSHPEVDEAVLNRVSAGPLVDTIRVHLRQERSDRRLNHSPISIPYHILFLLICLVSLTAPANSTTSAHRTGVACPSTTLNIEVGITSQHDSGPLIQLLHEMMMTSRERQVQHSSDVFSDQEYSAVSN